jgi:hypothetical protein
VWAVEGPLDDSPEESNTLLGVLDAHIGIPAEVLAQLLGYKNPAAGVIGTLPIEGDEPQGDQGPVEVALSRFDLCLRDLFNGQRFPR